MSSFKCFVLFLVCQTALVSIAHADVQFIIGVDDEANAGSMIDPDGDDGGECAKRGFSVLSSSCKGDKQPGLLCPFTPRYTDTCCSVRYAYDATATCSYGTVLSQDTCGGRHKCVCDEKEYPKGPGREICSGKFAYDEVNYCAEKFGSMEEIRYFKRCTCSSQFATCDASVHRRGAGDSCSVDERTYYSFCSCDPGYNKLCEKSSPKQANDYCLLNGKKYYLECTEDEEDDKSDSDTMNSVDQ